eukprot:7509903-Pyramimonas_sp.AAC.1
MECQHHGVRCGFKWGQTAMPAVAMQDRPSARGILINSLVYFKSIACRILSWCRRFNVQGFR